MKQGIVKTFFIQGLFALTWLNGMGQAFEPVSDQLPDVGSSTAVWADFNNDGLLDLALSGVNSGNQKTSGIYLNQGDGTFLSMGLGLEVVSDGALAAGDINNDGWIDLLLSGVNANDSRITRLYQNNRDGSFSAVDADLEGVGFSDVGFADFNNDGKTDIFLLGVNDDSERVTKLYKNTASDFEEVSGDFEGVSQGSMLLKDFNKDGYVDFLFHGVNNANQPVIFYYLNDQVGGYSLTTTGLPGLGNGKAATGDINSDGYPDLFLSGTRFGQSVTQVFLNNGGTTFTPYLSLVGVVENTATFGDFNNDGIADLFYSGLEGTVFKSYLYKNENSQPVNSEIAFPGVSTGNSSFADFNNDGKLDLFLTGYSLTAPVSNLYKNVLAETNTAPSAPTDIKVKTFNDSVIFSWKPGHDPETQEKGLTYNLYLGTAPEVDNIVPAGADITSGWRRIVEQGNLNDTFAIVKNLPEGKYFWGVQAIDQGYAGSPFTASEMFYVCYDIDIDIQRLDCGNEMELHYSEAKAGDKVAWYSDLDPNAPFSTEAHAAITLENSTTIRAVIDRKWGCQVIAERFIELNPPTIVNTGGRREICFGDSIQLGGTPTASGSFLPYTYRWSPTANMNNPADPNPTVWPTETTQYELTIFNGTCEVARSNVTVVVNLLPEIDAGQDQAVGLNEAVQLWASGGESYSWSPAEGLSDATIANPEARPLKTTTYYVTGINSKGCQNTDSVTIHVRSEVFIPNLFTPNGDGENDVLYVYGTGVRDLKLSIYDSHGIEVFSSSDMEKGWDGTINGNDAPTGNYIWTLKGFYYDGRPLDFKGKNKGSLRLVR